MWASGIRKGERFGRLPVRTRRSVFRRAGFTLVESLVVLAALAVLAAFLVPSLLKAREAALHAQCLSQLKQVGVAFAAYRFDFDDFVPAVNRWNRGHWRTDGQPNEIKNLHEVAYGWQEVLADLYLDRRDRYDLALYQCPFDAAGQAYRAAQHGDGVRDEQRLSYARVRADGLPDNEQCPDERRLAAYFWPYRIEEGVCRQAAVPDRPCSFGCPEGARLMNPSRVALLIENHESPQQIQPTWNAQVPYDWWWSFLIPGYTRARNSHPHWSHHRGGKTAVSTNVLFGDGHTDNLPPDARPHARWSFSKRPRGFPPRHPATRPFGDENPYGWLPIEF